MNRDITTDTGVYIALLASKRTNQLIQNFCSEINISLDSNNPIFTDGPLAKTLHSSLIFSDIGDYNNIMINHDILEGKPIQSKAVAWEIRKSKLKGTKVLGLRIFSEEILELHERVKKENQLIHNFSDYTPHISLHYNFQGEIPKEIPDFEIELNGLYIKKLENTLPINNKSNHDIEKKRKLDLIIDRKNLLRENPEDTQNICNFSSLIVPTTVNRKFKL